MEDTEASWKMLIVWKRRIYEQIWNLLKRRHEPFVQVGKSTIQGAGSGVFSRQHIHNDVPTVMCLYPGIYTPGMPSYGAHYLANQVPPSFRRGKGPSMHHNAYIMNLQSCGGYIDGWSIKSQHDGEKLDANHSACGHLVNHHAQNHNTAVYSFSWSEVLEHNETEHIAKRGGDEDHYFSLPNEMRSDGEFTLQ